MQVRYSTVFVIVVILMGSVLYEVTRTESFGRQSAARTQDISLPAPQAIVHTIRATPRMDYIGGSSVGAGARHALEPDQELAAVAASAVMSTPAAGRFAARTGSGNANAVAGGVSLAPRVSSSGGSGFAPGAYGMGGVGAWGGVSGVMRPIPAPKAVVTRTARVAKPAKPATPRRPGKGSGSSSSGGATGLGTAPDGTVASLTEGFTTGAVEPGAVASVQGATASTPKGPAPAATPEPMSLLLVGTGVIALAGVRRRFQ